MMKQTQKDILFWWDTLGINEKIRLSKKHHNKIYHQLNYMEKKIIWKHEPKPLIIHSVINWVACSKEIPLNRRVLAYLVLRNVETTIIASYSEDNGWMSKGENFTKNQVTHWKELPKPPCL